MKLLKLLESQNLKRMQVINLIEKFGFTEIQAEAILELMFID